jgi:hypothetical protein
MRRQPAQPTAEAAAVATRGAVRGRLAHVSVLASMRAGAWGGLVLGLVLGGPLGAFVAWMAGAIVGWQRDLSLTLGIARNLLPFGDQIGVLRTISTNWLIVVPAVALGTAVVAAVILSLVGGVLAAAYNATGGHASIVVDLEPGRGPPRLPDGTETAAVGVDAVDDEEPTVVAHQATDEEA